MSSSLEPKIKFIAHTKSGDVDENVVLPFNLLHRKSTKSKCSKFLLLHLDWGFYIFDISKRSIVDQFFIIDYDQYSISFKIYSKVVAFVINGKLKFSNLIRDTLSYQKRFNCFIELSRRCIDSSSFGKYSKERYNNEILLRGALNNIHEDRIKCLSSLYSSIIISDYSHTLLHILSYRGDERTLTKMLKESETIEIQVDAFGKSPIFYAILKKHQTSAQLFLKFLLEIKIQDQRKLFNNLSRIQNEFIILIKSSFKELPALLNRFVFETDYKMIPEITNLPKLLNSVDRNNPSYYLKADESIALIPTIIIYFSTILPIQTYSSENIELLESFART